LKRKDKKAAKSAEKFLLKDYAFLKETMPI
jgi:hypothetical protein